MEIIEYEELILRELKKVVENIVEENLFLPISAKSRAGAEISDFLEKKFADKTINHPYFKDSKFSPEGKTKNPWDALSYFEKDNHRELIWIDFKAVKTTSKGSNPDIGAADKLFKLMRTENGFYLVYIFVYYNSTDDGLEFKKTNEGDFVKLYFLKDIHKSFRRNTKNQLQINIDKPAEYRTRQEFIELLLQKIIEGYTRQKNIAEKELIKYNKPEIKIELLSKNKSQEESIKNI
jgi:hypothetical protein